MSHRTRHFDFPATTGFQFPAPPPLQDTGEIDLRQTSLHWDDEDFDNAEILEELIVDAAAAGKTLKCRLPGTLCVGTMQATVAGPVRWDFIHGVKFYGLEGFEGSVITLIGERDEFNNPFWDLNVRGVFVDNSQRPFVAAEASGSGFALQTFKHFEVHGYRCIGGADISTNPISGFGDSGLTINQCLSGRIWFPYCEAQPDVGIYITGGPSTAPTDDQGSIDIFGPYIRGCGSGIANKRQGRRVGVFGGSIVNCITGIGAVTAQTVGAGRELAVIGTTFKRLQHNCIHTQGEAKLTVTGVEIEDWGYNPVTEVRNAGFDYAFLLEGTSYGAIEASFKLRDWVDDGQLVAVRLETFVENAVTYTPVGNRVVSTVENTLNAIEEINTGITGNIYDLVIDQTVTTNPLTWAPSSLSHLIENWITGQRFERRPGNILDIDRIGTTGNLVSFRQDNVSQGTIQTTAAGYVLFSGGLRLPPYTAATLPTPIDQVVIYVSDGDAGNPCLAVARSGAWRRIPLGAAI